MFNKQFGSVFRTHHNPTYFSRRLFRFADIYTSNISNLLHYGKYKFSLLKPRFNQSKKYLIIIFLFLHFLVFWTNLKKKKYFWTGRFFIGDFLFMKHMDIFSFLEEELYHMNISIILCKYVFRLCSSHIRYIQYL